MGPPPHDQLPPDSRRAAAQHHHLQVRRGTRFTYSICDALLLDHLWMLRPTRLPYYREIIQTDLTATTGAGSDTSSTSIGQRPASLPTAIHPDFD